MKKLTAFILCVIFVLSLCGCKSNPPQESSYLYVETVEVSSKEESSKIENSSSKKEMPSKSKVSSEIKGAASPYSKGNGVVSSKYDNSTAAVKDEKEKMYGSVVAHISSDKVKALQSGMTYRMIFDALGKSSSAGRWTGYYEYVVDDDNLLMFYYENLDDVCNMSGEQLLETLIPLNSHLNNPENCTFYAIVVKNSNTTLTVTSPNYKFDCASVGLSNVKISFADGKEAKVSDIKQQQAVIIKHEKRVLTTNPPRVYAEEIIIQ
ncbi:MAG: hypothetical protein J6I80_03870 [Clostridia bacterium]|nr:hypothetical protein [Clostridia bacterium]